MMMPLSGNELPTLMLDNFLELFAISSQPIYLSGSYINETFVLLLQEMFGNMMVISINNHSFF